LIITERNIKGFDQDAVDEVVDIVNKGITAKNEKGKSTDTVPIESK